MCRTLWTALPLLGLAALLSAGTKAEPLERAEKQIESFLLGQIDSVSDFCNDLRGQQEQYIGIVPPGMPLLIQNGGMRYFKPGRLPHELRRGLVPTTSEGVTVYPITVCEATDTRERVFINAEGDTIYTLPAAAHYDPAWLVLKQVPDLYDGTRSKEEIAELLWRYDPSRIGIQYRLVKKQDMFDYIALKQKAVAEESELLLSSDRALLEASMRESTSMELHCAAIEPEGNGARLTIVYPAGFTNHIDLFSCTNLMDNLWRLRLDRTNTPEATTRFDWVDTGPVAHAGFYAIATADCDAQTDPDGDGLTSTRERLLHGTDPVLADSDGDGMPDGWEASHALNPLHDDTLNDPDGDGWNNLQEYKRGGDPTASFLSDTNNALGLILMTPTREPN